MLLNGLSEVGKKVSINLLATTFFFSLERCHTNGSSTSNKLLLFQFLGKILLFYLIFYVALAAFFMACWGVFATTIPEGRPKYELGESIIGENPGLGFRPMPPESNVESTLIWYEKNNPNNTKYWIEEIGHFLEGKLQTSLRISFYLKTFLSPDYLKTSPQKMIRKERRSTAKEQNRKKEKHA